MKFIYAKDLKKYFPIRSGLLLKITGFAKAVDGVSFHIEKGETLGVVGESGSGKTTLGRVIIGLIKPTYGEVWFEGKNIFELSKKEERETRRYMQIVFQDPFSSLNPRMTVLDIVSEPLLNFKLIEENEKEEIVFELLRNVGLKGDDMGKYPHEFSGGQMQRVVIARALALNPKFIVLDEPTSALDVSVQAQILNLIRKLQEDYNLTYLFISHNLLTINHISDRIVVMYVGKIVEAGDKEDIFEYPLHPYTKALLSSIPVPDIETKMERIVLRGDVPSPINPPSGCRFHTRCPHVRDKCRVEEPALIQDSKDRVVACHFYKNLL